MCVSPPLEPALRNPGIEAALHKELLQINLAAAITSDSPRRAPRWLCRLETSGPWQGLYLCFLIICPYIGLYIYFYIRSRALAQKQLFSLATPSVSLCLVSKAHTWKVKGQTAAPGRVSHLSARPPGLFFQVDFMRATRQEEVCNRAALLLCVLGPSLGQGRLKSESITNAATGLKNAPLVGRERPRGYRRFGDFWAVLAGHCTTRIVMPFGHGLPGGQWFGNGAWCLCIAPRPWEAPRAARCGWANGAAAQGASFGS